METNANTLKDAIHHLQSEIDDLRNYVDIKNDPHISNAFDVFSHLAEELDHFLFHEYDDKIYNENSIHWYEFYRKIQDIIVPCNDCDIPTMLNSFITTHDIFNHILYTTPDIPIPEEDARNLGLVKQYLCLLHQQQSDILDMFQPIEEFFIKRSKVLIQKELEKNKLKLQLKNLENNT